MGELGKLIYLPVPANLSPEQERHWEEVLETAERMRENALRMLGRLGIEKGLEEL